MKGRFKIISYISLTAKKLKFILNVNKEFNMKMKSDQLKIGNVVATNCEWNSIDRVQLMFFSLIYY